VKRPTPIHETLRAERTRRGFTVDQLAALAGINRTTVFNIERGVGAQLHSVLAMAGALGLELTLTPKRAAASAPPIADEVLSERYGRRPWTGVA
jgi:transcriptional regulator with XRE-family HTH domain